MTSKDLSIFNSLRPFSIGFDDMFDQFENMLGNGNLTMQSNYPPYNIRKTGKDNYAIEVALAGFSKKDVEVEFEDNLLTVRTKQVNKSENSDVDGEIIHKGISQRQFARSFTIADDVKVNGAELKDGLLTISCESVHWVLADNGSLIGCSLRCSSFFCLDACPDVFSAFGFHCGIIWVKVVCSS
jgi:molecular chaperone IbpA